MEDWDIRSPLRLSPSPDPGPKPRPQADPQVQSRSRAPASIQGYACNTVHYITSYPASHVPEGLYIRVPLALGPLQERKITCSGRSPVPDFITVRHADALLIDHCTAWRTAAIRCMHVAGSGSVSG